MLTVFTAYNKENPFIIAHNQNIGSYVKHTLLYNYKELFFKNFYFIEVLLIYNVILVSGIQ